MPLQGKNMKDEGENQDTDNQANDNVRAVPRDLLDSGSSEKKRTQNSGEREKSQKWTFSYHNEIKPEPITKWELPHQRKS